MLLIVLILFLGISGCFCPKPPEPRVEIKTVYVYNPCTVPDKPNYLNLDKSSHLGSAYNINILIGNAQKMKTYNNGLVDAIMCYEKQTENYKKDNKK
jgi:hypothetical protein